MAAGPFTRYRAGSQVAVTMRTRWADIWIERAVPCYLRDGTRLDADIYRPDTDEPLPVLLMRQPYGRQIASTVTYAHPAWFAHQGYLVVVQDVRGRGTSEGLFNPFVQEVDDGYDAVEWAARLPGSSGRVGMYGFSYQGSTQWAAAAAAPPHLVAIAPAMCAADLYHGWFYPLGRFALGSELPWACQLARDTARRAGDDSAEARLSQLMRHREELCWQLPWAHHEAIEATGSAFFREWVSHPEYDAYWSERNWLSALAAHPIAALHVAGWFDPYLMGSLQSFQALAGTARDRAPQRLIIGPWAHIPWGRRAAGVDLGPWASAAIDQELVRWFDYWLKGDADGCDPHGAPVRYFELGSGRWREADGWPPAPATQSHQRTWFLSAVAPANGAAGGGQLRAQPASTVGRDYYVYDARLPMPCASYLPEDRSAVQERREILVYTTMPLTDRVCLAGQPTLTLWVQTLDGPTDLVALLSEVLPDGSARFLSVGRATIGDHSSGGDVQWQAVTVSLRPLAVQLAAGASLRLEVTSSAFPLIARHPNGLQPMAIPWARSKDLAIATVAVAHGGAYRSCLTLPVVGCDDGRDGGAKA